MLPKFFYLVHSTFVLY